MDTLDMTLADRMIYFRAMNRLTQKELAKMAGVSNATVNAVENGSSPSKLTRARIEIAMGEPMPGIKRI